MSHYVPAVNSLPWPDIASRGAQDPLYTKWFGNGDYISVIGSYQAILSSNKANMTLRCDNPDGNCQNAGWAGHWRGSNATSETVICPLSYQIREPLSEVCDHSTWSFRKCLVEFDIINRSQFDRLYCIRLVGLLLLCNRPDASILPPSGHC